MSREVTIPTKTPPRQPVSKLERNRRIISVFVDFQTLLRSKRYTLFEYAIRSEFLIPVSLITTPHCSNNQATQHYHHCHPPPPTP